MARTDYLVTLLNMKSIRFDSVSSSDATPELTMLDVHAALAMGNLSNEAELIGRAIHMKDEMARRQVRDIAAMRVREMFIENSWSMTKPFQNHIKAYLENGSITADHIQAVRTELGVRLFKAMAQLAISQLTADGDCLTCDGSGHLRDKTTCTTCKGRRKYPWTEEYKAMFCVSIQIDAWNKTWKPRYQVVYLELQPWLIEFEEHLLRYCR